MLLALASSLALSKHSLTPLGPRAMEDSGYQLVARLLRLTSPPSRTYFLYHFDLQAEWRPLVRSPALPTSRGTIGYCGSFLRTCFYWPLPDTEITPSSRLFDTGCSQYSVLRGSTLISHAGHFFSSSLSCLPPSFPGLTPFHCHAGWVSSAFSVAILSDLILLRFRPASS